MELDTLREQLLALGAYRTGLVETASIRLDRSFRAMCEMNTCGAYGRCWMCPPDVGEIDVLMDRARSFDKALVYQTVSPLEDSYDFEGMMAAAHRHAALSHRVTEWCRGAPFQSYLHLGAGGCHICKVCAKRTDEPCRHPELALPSLEACGIQVSELAALAGMNYINGQNTVTYFGAVLFNEA